MNPSKPHPSAAVIVPTIQPKTHSGLGESLLSNQTEAEQSTLFTQNTIYFPGQVATPEQYAGRPIRLANNLIALVGSDTVALTFTNMLICHHALPVDVNALNY
jgi:hypothetical protein